MFLILIEKGKVRNEFFSFLKKYSFEFLKRGNWRRIVQPIKERLKIANKDKNHHVV